jgi:hypothetical protein
MKPIDVLNVKMDMLLIVLDNVKLLQTQISDYLFMEQESKPQQLQEILPTVNFIHQMEIFVYSVVMVFYFN